jgi:hypothetical protein
MNSERWQKVDELYQAALKCDQSRRSAFLADRCRDDEGLRRVVESLLAQDETVLEQPAGQPRELAPGARMGPYEILSALGAGARSTARKIRG